MRFSGKTVYITEADSAQGEALAERFAKEGANLVLGNAGQDLMEKVSALGAKAICVTPDLLTNAGVDALIEEVQKTFPRIDVLVHNNNRAVKCSLEDMTQDVLFDALDYNTKSAFFATKQIGAHMGKFGNGKIVYVSSFHDDKPTGSTPAYSISKGAITMLCKESALFNGRMGIQTNVIEAGALEGDDQIFQSEFAGQYVYMQERIPNKTPGTNKDIAGIAAFLASEDADHINGASLRADGGFMLHYRFH